MNNNAAIIISPDGTQINVKEKQEETLHYQLFERINNEIIPGIIDDLVIDLRAYSGYHLSLITASKEYIIIMKWNLNKKSNDFILAIPPEITKEQHDKINNILKELKEKAVYLFVCENNGKTNHLFPSPKVSYHMSYQEEKSIDEINEISIIEQKNNYSK